MSWVSPSTRTTGTLITASIWNQDVVANTIAAVHVLAEDNSSVAVANTVTETTLFSYTLAAGFLGLGQTLHLRLSGVLVNNTGGAQTANFRIKGQGLTLISGAKTYNVVTQPIEIEAFITNIGVATSQWVFARLTGAHTSGAATWTDLPSASSGAMIAGIATAMNLGSSALFSVTLEFGAANANFTFTKYAGSADVY